MGTERERLTSAQSGKRWIEKQTPSDQPPSASRRMKSQSSADSMSDFAVAAYNLPHLLNVLK